MQRRIPGSSALSDRMLFEVELTWPPGHHFEGQPRRLGQPLPEARRAQLVLANGSRMDVTLHEDEIADLPARLPELHRRICEGLVWESANRALTGAAPLNETQQAHAEATLLAIVHNPPLGVLAVENWAAIWKRNARN
jgi:hypothetical protein